jgi:KDO2-lipid IV(A) lauroyltransferase
MNPSHVFETLLTRALIRGVRALPWRPSLAFGAALGDTLRRSSLRRRVAAENLAHAFPSWSAEQREQVLRENYRELGRVAAEYARLADLARRDGDEVVAETHGLEHPMALRGRGVLFLTGHFGNFELLGAWVARMQHLDFVARPLANPGVDALLMRERAKAGVGLIPADRTGVRRIYEALRENGWVAMLADQDGGRNGVFVPFLGRPASTAIGPARIALATGVPIVMAHGFRRADGRHGLVMEAPLVAPDPRAPDAAERLTAMHVARVEQWVRERPASWFWLHRRWKTRPPLSDEANGAAAREGLRQPGARAL